MRRFHKCVKYFSMFLAILLASLIISGAIQIVFSVAESISPHNVEDVRKKAEIDATNKEDLIINAANCSISIEAGETVDKIVIYTNKEDISIDAKANYIKIKSKSWFSIQDNNARVKIEVPKNKKILRTNIEVGVGNVHFENCDLGKVNVDLKAGNIQMKQMQADTSNLYLNFGTMSLEGRFKDQIYASVGLGEINATCTDGLENYSITAQAGIGGAKVQDKKIIASEWNKGIQSIDFECALGDIQIWEGK